MDTVTLKLRLLRAMWSCRDATVMAALAAQLLLANGAAEAAR